MGRSTRLQAQENRKRILAETEETMRAKGVNGVNILDVMARAGMTRGGFYNHFDSKAALIAEACATAFDRTLEGWEANVSRGASTEGAFERVVAKFLSRRPGEKVCPVIALGYDSAPHHADADLNRAYRNGVEQLFGMFMHVAEEDSSCRLTEEEVLLAFCAMVGANMLSLSTGDPGWATRVKQSLAAAPVTDRHT